MKPFTDVKAALEFAKSFQGSAREFQLPIDDSLQDPIGLNMALVLDYLLTREWEPDGYEQKDGDRIYRYREWAQ
jgi:hypothetical protein